MCLRNVGDGVTVYINVIDEFVKKDNHSFQE